MRAVIRLLITKYVLKRGGICCSCNVNALPYTSDLHLSDTEIPKKKENSTNLIKIIFRIPSNLRITFVCVWLGFVIGSRTDLRSVRITRLSKHAQYVETQEDLFFQPHEHRKGSTKDIVRFGYNYRSNVLLKHGRFLLKQSVCNKQTKHHAQTGKYKRTIAIFKF